MNSEKDHHADVAAVDATTNKVTAEAEGHNRFFGAQSTRTTKKQETASTKPSTNFLNMIQLQPLAISQKELKKMKPTSDKYQRFVHWSKYEGRRVLPPPLDIVEKLDALSLTMQELKLMDPEPDDYFDRAIAIQNDIDQICPIVKEQFTVLADAVLAYHHATLCRQLCKHDNLLSLGSEWDVVQKSLISLGVPDYMSKALAARNKAVAEAKEMQRLRVQATKRVLEVTTDSQTTSVSQEQDAVQIVIATDRDGNSIDVSTGLARGKASERDREALQKPKTVNKAAKSRTGVRDTKGMEMTEKKFRLSLSKSWKYLTFSGKDKKGHGLTLVNGRLYCSLCHTPIATKIGQHLGTHKHQSIWTAEQRTVISAKVIAEESESDAMDRLENEAIAEYESEVRGKNLCGTSLQTHITKYRVQVLEHALSANISIGQLARFAPALDLKGPKGIGLGNIHDLRRTIGIALMKKQKKCLTWVMEGCYDLHACTIDGSPLGANAECLIIRMVRRADHKIVEFLISLRLYKNGLTGENIAMNVLTELARYGRDNKDWRGIMMDRAANNGRALKEIRRLNILCPQAFPCFSHTFTAPGKEFKKTCKELHQFRKAFNGSIMFRGKMVDIFKSLFGFRPKIAGGVRWYLEWEQVEEMDGVGLVRIVQLLIPAAELAKVSAKSVAKMKKVASKKVMPILIVQAAAVADIGQPFCIATYLTEGDDPLAFGMYTVLKDLDMFVSGGAKFPEGSRTYNRCKEAAAMVVVLREDLVEVIIITEEEIFLLENEALVLHLQIPPMEEEPEVRNVEEQTGRGQRRTQRHDYYAQAHGHRHRTQEQHEEPLENAQELYDLKLEEIRNVNANLSEFRRDLIELDVSLGPITEEDFIRYAESIVECAFEKYRLLFEKDADLIRSRSAFMGCKAFDILYLRLSPSVIEVERLVDKLVNFVFDEFSDEFISGMKSEIPDLLELVNSIQFDFEEEPDPSNLYRNRVLARARRARQRAIICEIERIAGDGNDVNNQLPDDIEGELREGGNIDRVDITAKNWKDDPGERARRIYEWWRISLLSFEELLEIIHCKISLNSEHLSGAIKVSGMISMFMVNITIVPSRLTNK